MRFEEYFQRRRQNNWEDTWISKKPYNKPAIATVSVVTPSSRLAPTLYERIFPSGRKQFVLRRMRKS